MVRCVAAMVLLALGCSSTAETRTTFVERDEDAGVVEPGPDGAAGTGGLGSDSGSEPDSAKPPALGSPCWASEGVQGHVCSMPDRSLGCASIASPARCDPFPDAG